MTENIRSFVAAEFVVAYGVTNNAQAGNSDGDGEAKKATISGYQGLFDHAAASALDYKLNTMETLRCIFLILLILVPGAAEAAKDDDWKSKYDPNNLARISEIFQQARIDFLIVSDPVKRAIVCRLPFAMFTLDTLSLATGLTRHRLAVAVNELVQLGLLKWVPTGKHLFVAPASRETRIKMFKWADIWCVGDDTCGVAR